MLSLPTLPTKEILTKFETDGPFTTDFCANFLPWVHPIPSWLLKCISTTISPILCHLCNLSFHYGIFPAQLKHARVIPHLKKPTLDRDISNSYRSISNLSFISKLVERLVAKHFTGHANLHCVSKNDTDVAHYNFNAHQLILEICGYLVTGAL